MQQYMVVSIALPGSQDELNCEINCCQTGMTGVGMSEQINSGLIFKTTKLHKSRNYTESTSTITVTNLHRGQLQRLLMHKMTVIKMLHITTDL